MAKHEPVAAPSSHRAIYTLAALIALGGLADAIYLTVQALTGQTLSCGGSPDCSRVLGSDYARVGGMPIAGFGTIAYYFAFSCATFAACGSRRAEWLFSRTVTVMFLVTLWLLSVQAFLLHAFCRYCLFSAAATFLLTGLVLALPEASKRVWTHPCQEVTT